MTYENPNPIDPTYLNVVRELYMKEGFEREYPVLDMLDDLHKGSFDCLAKAYDWYTFGRWQAVARGLLTARLSGGIRKLLREEIMTRSDASSLRIKEQLRKCGQDPENVDLLTGLLIQAQGLESLKAWIKQQENKGLVSGASRMAKNTELLPHGFWVAVGRLYKRHHAVLEEDLNASVLAFMAFYTDESVLEDLAGKCFRNNAGTEIEPLLAQCMSLVETLTASEKILVESGSLSGIEAYHQLVGESWGMKGNECPYLLTRVALAAAVFKKYYEEWGHPGNDDENNQDFPNWLINWCWPHFSVRQINYSRLDNSNPFHGLQQHLAGHFENIKRENLKWKNEYYAAETWFENSGRGGSVALQVRAIRDWIANTYAIFFVQQVWRRLNQQPEKQQAAVLSAVSKLGVALGYVKTETNATQYFRSWSGRKPGAFVNWIDRFESHFSKSGKKLQKKATTDVIVSVAEIAHRVTGCAANVNDIELVQMARKHFFSDSTRHDSEFLKEPDLPDDPLWEEPVWSQLNCLSHLDLNRPRGLPHQWLWGSSFFEAVVRAMQAQDFALRAGDHWAKPHLLQNQQTEAGAHRWTVRLLCVPWAPERLPMHQLSDRCSAVPMFAMIKHVFDAGSDDDSLLRNLKPVWDCQAAPVGNSPPLFMPRMQSSSANIE